MTATYPSGGLSSYLVEVVEPGEGADDSGRRPRLKTSRVRWPRDPTAALEAAVARYRDLGEFHHRHQDQPPPPAEA